MAGIALKSRVRRQIRAIGLGFVLSATVIQLGHAQSPASFSAMFGQPNLTAGTALAGAEGPPAGQVAALSTLEPDGRILVEPGQPLQFAYSTGPLGVFVNGLGQFGSRDMTSTVNAFSFNNAGFIAGADYLFTPQLVAGLAFGYTRSSTNFDTSAVSAPSHFLRADLLQGNLYATYYNDAFYLNGIGLIGGSNNNSRRHIVLPT